MVFEKRMVVSLSALCSLTPPIREHSLEDSKILDKRLRQKKPLDPLLIPQIPAIQQQYEQIRRSSDGACWRRQGTNIL